MFERMKLWEGFIYCAVLSATDEGKELETNRPIFIRGIRYLWHRSSSGTEID